MSATGTGGQQPTTEELNAMSREELARLGARLDGVELVEYGPRYVPGSPADKNAERSVAKWFLLTALFGVVFVVIFVAWPQHYETAYSDKQWVFALYNPLIGLTLGLTILLFGMGCIALAKKVMPHEVALQKRHDGFSAEVDRRTLGAEVADIGDKSGLVKRRGMLKGSLLLAGGGLGAAALVPVLGGLIKNPWEKGPLSDLWVTPWRPGPDGKNIRLTQIDGTPIRPADMAAGAMVTVFPGVPGGAKASDAAVMLFRLRSNDPVKLRKGQEGFRYGDFYAYSKICTHVGCPVSLYEQQTGRILCPCHQSQFDVNNGARPVFGPATRPLPQLPITVDDEGYFIAVSDFIEPVGPGFWESYQGSAKWESS
jgi:ubiquinol-cytochrome c reductase iron-sulfur subunit